MNILRTKCDSYGIWTRVTLYFECFIASYLRVLSLFYYNWKFNSCDSESSYIIAIHLNFNIKSTFLCSNRIFQVTNQDYLLHLIGSRFTELRVIELATDLITPNILHELAARCPQLWSMTLGMTPAFLLFNYLISSTFKVLKWSKISESLAKCSQYWIRQIHLII